MDATGILTRGPACTSDDAHTCRCSYHQWLHHTEAIESADHDELED